MSHLLFRLLFVFPLIASRRCRCLLRSARVNAMSERLISEILAGEIPGFRFKLCRFSPSYLASFCVSVFSLFCFFFGGHSQNDTQDVIIHIIPIAGCDSTSLCSVWFGLVVVVCFLFCLLLFWFGLFLMGFAHWTVYWSITSAFQADGLAPKGGKRPRRRQQQSAGRTTNKTTQHRGATAREEPKAKSKDNPKQGKHGRKKDEL